MSARARDLLLLIEKIFPSWGRKFSLTRAQKWGNECSLSLIYCRVKFFDSLLQVVDCLLQRFKESGGVATVHLGVVELHILSALQR
jgi:hypothetical protein